MLLEIIIVGILQGLLEWFPISSQGNIILFMISIFGMNGSEALKLSVYLHAGTLLSVLVYFRKIFRSLLKAFPKYMVGRSDKKENRLITFLIVSTILTGIIGYPIFKFAEASAPVGPLFSALIGASLILTGILQKSIRKLGRRTINDINMNDGLLLGIVQGLSAFPGISRSGITLSFLIFREFNSKSALTLSFIMSVPAILAAETGLILTGEFPTIQFWEVIIGCLFSFTAGVFSISLLLKLAQKIDLWKFCIIIGALALISSIYPS